MDKVEQDLERLKEEQAKVHKQVENTLKGLKKVQKKVNGHDTEADTTGGDGNSGLVPGLGDRRGARTQ